MHHSVCNIAYRVGHRGRITFCFVKASGVASDPVASVTEEYVDHNNVRRFGMETLEACTVRSIHIYEWDAVTCLLNFDPILELTAD